MIPSVRQTKRKTRGVVTVMVVTVLVLISALLLTFVERTLIDRRQTLRESQREQTLALAEAGILRARLRSNSDADYRGETWEVPVGLIHPVDSATVEISVAEQQLQVVALFPKEAPRPIRVTRKVPLKP